MADFASPTVLAKTYAIHPSNDHIGFNYLDDPDLYFAIGGNQIRDFLVTFAVERDQNGNLWCRSSHIVGTIVDLYDFDIDQNGPFLTFMYANDFKRGAIIQAGFGTQGISGRVFRSETQLNGAVDFNLLV